MSTGSMSGIAVAFRVRGGVTVLAAMVLYALIVWVLPPGYLPVPGRHGVEALLWPAAPLIVTVPLLGMPRLWQRPLELTGSRPLVTSAAWLLFSSTALGTLVSRLAPAGRQAVLDRNLLLLLGVASLSCLLPLTVIWLPPVTMVLLMWLIGTRAGGTAERWALLFLPGGVDEAERIAAITFGIGVAAFLIRAWMADAGFTPPAFEPDDP